MEKIIDQIVGGTGGKGSKWITANETMQMLGITSKATLQQLRDTGRIKFVQPSSKIIMYDRDSISDLLNNH